MVWGAIAGAVAPAIVGGLMGQQQNNSNNRAAAQMNRENLAAQSQENQKQRDYEQSNYQQGRKDRLTDTNAFFDAISPDGKSNLTEYEKAGVSGGALSQQVGASQQYQAQSAQTGRQANQVMAQQRQAYAQQKADNNRQMALKQQELYTSTGNALVNKLNNDETNETNKFTSLINAGYDPATASKVSQKRTADHLELSAGTRAKIGLTNSQKQATDEQASYTRQKIKSDETNRKLNIFGVRDKALFRPDKGPTGTVIHAGKVSAEGKQYNTFFEQLDKDPATAKVFNKQVSTLEASFFQQKGRKPTAKERRALIDPVIRKFQKFVGIRNKKSDKGKNPNPHFNK